MSTTELRRGGVESVTQPRNNNLESSDLKTVGFSFSFLFNLYLKPSTDKLKRNEKQIH